MSGAFHGLRKPHPDDKLEKDRAASVASEPRGSISSSQREGSPKIAPVDAEDELSEADRMCEAQEDVVQKLSGEINDNEATCCRKHVTFFCRICTRKC